jgi:transposase-like protein
MGKRFTQSFKLQAVQKAFSRDSHISVREIAASMNVGHSTLDRWMISAKNNELAAPTEEELTNLNDMINEKRPQDWSLEEKLEMIITCASLNEEKISELCREKGIFPHHVQQWKKSFTKGTVGSQSKSRLSSETKVLRHENKKLQKDLNRKNKALAETAALLVLQKKVNTLWGSSEDDSQ